MPLIRIALRSFSFFVNLFNSELFNFLIGPVNAIPIILSTVFWAVCNLYLICTHPQFVSADSSAAKIAAQANFVEIEVETLAQLHEALDAGATMVLLDNMDLPTLREAVRINAGRAILEISGGVTLAGLRELANAYGAMSGAQPKKGKGRK